MSRFRPGRLSVLVLALLAYVPALASSPGRMTADTKLYLYLDPGELIRAAPFAWDAQQFGGWVPHQMIAYLWPSGPFYWALDTIGLPDWVAHRLWLGSLFFLAGWGAWWLARRLGLSVTAALVAAIVYQCSPYVVPYVSRTSVMLLPWAALGWLTVVVWNAYRTASWRWTAVAALILATVGSVNATALLMIVPGPVLLVLWEWGHGRLAHRSVLTSTARMVVACTAVSVWWVAMLSIQGRYGGDVLSFSETLSAVSFTSSSTEVVRSMGYWLAYVVDQYAPATTAALAYMNSVPLLVLSFAVPLLAMVGLLVVRWRYRGFAALLVLTGIVLGIGFHPYDDPAPLFAPFRDSGLGLAIRSSTRALPLLALGLGLAAGSGLAAMRVWRPRTAQICATAFIVLAVLNLPALWRTQYVDPALERDQDPPAAWLAAADELTSSQQRVLQIPGSEFGAFRWGYTVDPPLPGITDQPLITRDLLPLGSPGVMDLLYALDNHIQAGTLDTRAIAPVARLLGADTVWVSNDMTFERFRTPRPERFDSDMSADIAGLGPVRSFGSPFVSTPSIPMLDEQELSDPLIGTEITPVLLRSVADPVPMASTAQQFVVVDGSGDGVVAAAAAGWLTGREPIVYANDLDASQWQALPTDTLFVVTDSNRDRTLQWRSSQDTIGMTEQGGPGTDGLRVDPQNQRLDVFDTDDPATQTHTVFDGPIATASSYGEQFALLPEYRPAMAVDGDPTTAWLVSQVGLPFGETITVGELADDRLQLLQPQDPQQRLMITGVEIDRDGATTTVELGPDSLVAPGQLIDVPGDGPVTVRITGIAERPDAPRTGTYFVGFAELGPQSTEYVQLPSTTLGRLGSDARLAIVMQRERTRSTNRWRADPEPQLRRQFTLPAAAELPLEVTVRLHGRATDDVLDGLSGRVGPTSDRRLAGVAAARASGAFDGDPSTAWTTPFSTALGSTLQVDLGTPSATTLRLVQPADGRHSTITELTITDPAGTQVVAVASPVDGASSLALGRALVGSVSIVVSGVAAVDTIDRRFGDVVELPASIVELGGIEPTWSTTSLDTCRTDLLEVDGQPVGLRIADITALLAGEAVVTTTCDGAPLKLGAGTHRVVSADAVSTGIAVDLVALGAAADRPGDADADRRPAALVQHSPTSWSVTTEPCAEGCWLVFRQGFNRGWTATAEGTSLGEPRQLDGGFTGWWLPASDSSQQVDIGFAPQRQLTAALAVSAIAVLLCLVAAIGWRRRIAVARDDVAAPALVVPWKDTTRRRAVIGAVAVMLAAVLLVGPVWAVPAAAIAAALAIWRTPRWVAASAWIGAGLLAVAVAGEQLVQRYDAGTGWPVHFESLHRPMLFCLVVMTIASLAAQDERT